MHNLNNETQIFIFRRNQLIVEGDGAILRLTNLTFPGGHTRVPGCLRSPDLAHNRGEGG